MNTFSNIGLSIPPILQQHMSNTSTGKVPNGTAGHGLPASMMDSFIMSASHASPLMQLFMFFYRLLGSQLGLEPSVILTIFGIIWGAFKVSSLVYAYCDSLVGRYLRCSVNIDEDDPIYRHVMNWLSMQPSMNTHLCLTAETVWKSAWEEEAEESVIFWTDGGQGEDDLKYLNFSNLALSTVKNTTSTFPALNCANLLICTEPSICSRHGFHGALVQG